MESDLDDFTAEIYKTTFDMYNKTVDFDVDSLKMIITALPIKIQGGSVIDQLNHDELVIISPSTTK